MVVLGRPRPCRFVRSSNIFLFRSLHSSTCCGYWSFRSVICPFLVNRTDDFKPDVAQLRGRKYSKPPHIGDAQRLDDELITVCTIGVKTFLYRFLSALILIDAEQVIRRSGDHFSFKIVEDLAFSKRHQQSAGLRDGLLAAAAMVGIPLTLDVLYL